MKSTALWVAVAVTICAPLVSAQTIQVDKNNRTIAITATDKATAEADIAVVTVGFQIFAPDAPTAYSQGSQLSNAIMDALKKAGVPDKAIESQDQRLARTEFPANDKSTAEQRAQRQFTLSQSWRVHAPAHDAAAVLHIAIRAGAIESGGIEWDLADRPALQAQAAAKALVHARAIADQMAAGLGARLGSLIYAGNQAPEQDAKAYGMGGTAGELMPQVSAPLAIRPQPVEESATVYAVFAIE